MNNIYGVNPPVPTLFAKDGSIDYEANKQLADFLIEHGVNGLAYFGTTGEFSVLRLEEKKEFIKTMTEYVNHRVNVIAGVGSTCLSETIELAQSAKEDGVDAVLVVNPYFSIYDDNMVEAYYDAVADEVELPIVIYNYPGLTGFCFSKELVGRLILKHDNIIGIKETIADMDHVKSMLELQRVKKDFRVFIAFEDQGLEALKAGASGFVNATCIFAPEFTVGLYNAFVEGNDKKAQACFEKMDEAMEMYRYSQPLFLACKHAVYERVFGGDDRFGVRLPALPISDAGKLNVHMLLIELGLI